MLLISKTLEKTITVVYEKKIRLFRLNQPLGISLYMALYIAVCSIENWRKWYWLELILELTYIFDNKPLLIVDPHSAP